MSLDTADFHLPCSQCQIDGLPQQSAWATAILRLTSFSRVPLVCPQNDRWSMISPTSVHVTMQDVKCCVMQDVKLAEASASQAAAQLLAEEQQAAARVAAKKAKKVKQKQAKEQVLQAEPAQVQDAQPLDSPQTAVDSKSTIAEPATPAQRTPSARLSAAAHTGSLNVDTDSSDSTSGRPMPTADQSQLADVSANGSVELSDGTADKGCVARNGTSDADFLRSLFCCPITHVRPQLAIASADGIWPMQTCLRIRRCHAAAQYGQHELCYVVHDL